jgi:prevent-host-death family protein
MSAKHISVAEAKARFSALLDGVLHRGERYVIERHGHEVAAVIGVGELEQLEPGRPEAGGGAMTLVGLWQDIPDADIDALLADLRSARGRDGGRSVDLRD